MKTTETLKYSATKGIQKPDAYETESGGKESAFLESLFLSEEKNEWEQAGQTITVDGDQRRSVGVEPGRVDGERAMRARDWARVHAWRLLALADCERATCHAQSIRGTGIAPWR